MAELTNFVTGKIASSRLAVESISTTKLVKLHKEQRLKRDDCTDHSTDQRPLLQG